MPSLGTSTKTEKVILLLSTTTAAVKRESTSGFPMGRRLLIKVHRAGGELTEGTLFPEPLEQLRGTLTGMGVSIWPPSMITVPEQLEFMFGSQTDLLLNTKDQTDGGESTGATIFLELPAPHLETLTEIFIPIWLLFMTTDQVRLEFMFGSQTDLLLNTKDQTDGGESTGAIA